MKVRPSIWSITWRYILVAVIVSSASLAMFFSLFFNFSAENGSISIYPWGPTHYVYVIVLSVSIIGVYIFSVVSYYYVIEDKYFVVKKFGREIEFNYDNIEFIDFAQSEKKRQVIFYSTKGKMRFLLGDKEGKLLETLRKKCPNTLTVSEFRSKHPEERY